MRLFFQILLGAVLALVAMEGGLRLLPVSTATHTGYYIHPHILTYPPNHRFTTSSGWDLRNPVQQRANNYGFLTSRAVSYTHLDVYKRQSS